MYNTSSQYQTLLNNKLILSKLSDKFELWSYYGGSPPRDLKNKYPKLDSFDDFVKQYEEYSFILDPKYISKRCCIINSLHNCEEKAMINFNFDLILYFAKMSPGPDNPDQYSYDMRNRLAKINNNKLEENQLEGFLVDHIDETFCGFRSAYLYDYILRIKRDNLSFPSQEIIDFINDLYYQITEREVERSRKRYIERKQRCPELFEI